MGQVLGPENEVICIVTLLGGISSATSAGLETQEKSP
jgi:hypothetical protein